MTEQVVSKGSGGDKNSANTHQIHRKTLTLKKNWRMETHTHARTRVHTHTHTFLSKKITEKHFSC